MPTVDRYDLRAAGLGSDREREIAARLRGGALAIYPTDTLYALGCCALDGEAVSRLRAAKGRESDKPLPVIAAEVSRWEEVAIDPLQEGTSDTSVGVLVEMYARDGTLLWSAKESITEHSRPYLPDFNLRGTESGRAVTTSRGAVPEPPEVKKVAEKLAEVVMSTIPNVKQKDREKVVPEEAAAPDSAGMQD